MYPITRFTDVGKKEKGAEIGGSSQVQRPYKQLEVYWLLTIAYLGVMSGTTPLTRSLPEISKETKALCTVDEGLAGVTCFAGKLAEDSVIPESESSIVNRFSSCRTTSPIDGLSCASSWQHLRAKVMNFSEHSEGWGPIRSSKMENKMPDWYALFT